MVDAVEQNRDGITLRNFIYTVLNILLYSHSKCVLNKSLVQLLDITMGQVSEDNNVFSTYDVIDLAVTPLRFHSFFPLTL